MSAERQEIGAGLGTQAELERKFQAYVGLAGVTRAFEAMRIIHTIGEDVTLGEISDKLREREFVISEKGDNIDQFGILSHHYFSNRAFWTSALEVYEQHRQRPEFIAQFGDPDAGIK